MWGASSKPSEGATLFSESSPCLQTGTFCIGGPVTPHLAVQGNRPFLVQPQLFSQVQLRTTIPFPPTSASLTSVSSLVLSYEWVPREILRKTRHPPVTPGCNKQPPRFSRMFYVSSLPPSHKREDPPFK